MTGRIKTGGLNQEPEGPSSLGKPAAPCVLEAYGLNDQHRGLPVRLTLDITLTGRQISHVFAEFQSIALEIIFVHVRSSHDFATLQSIGFNSLQLPPCGHKPYRWRERRRT